MEKPSKLTQLCSAIEKYPAQKIVHYTSGGIFLSSAVTVKNKPFGKEIFYGRLEPPGYHIDFEKPSLSAKTKILCGFTPSNGWVGCGEYRIPLDEFIPQMENPHEHSQKDKRKTETFLRKIEKAELKSTELDGIIIKIPRPHGGIYGGYAEYDEDPYKILIVGDELVDSFLARKDLNQILRIPTKLPKV